MSLEFQDGTKIRIIQETKIGRDTNGHIIALFNDDDIIRTWVRDTFISRIAFPEKEGTFHLKQIDENQFKLAVPSTSANHVDIEYEDGKKDKILPGNNTILNKNASIVVGEKYNFSIEKSKLYVFNENQLRKLRRIAVFGDIHGDYYALSSLLKLVDPRQDGIVFLGDYADRGQYGVEVIDAVKSLMKYHNVVPLSGNHEDYDDNGEPGAEPCDLKEEVEIKKGNWQEYFNNQFKPFTRNLYLAAMIPDETLLVHGGISSDIRTKNDLMYPTKSIVENVHWSDPINGNGESSSYRGAGNLFGSDVSRDLCNRLGVKRIIRSHEPRKASEGPYYEHDNRVITISSTSVYCGKPFILFIDPKNPSVMEPHYLD